MPCLFCSFARETGVALTVYADKETIAFLDIHPRSPGHTMVIPRKHRENILELSDIEIAAVFRTVRLVTDILRRALNPQGFTIGINHGTISGQVIEHLHVHIIPRFSGDQGTSLHSVVHNPPQESVEEIHKRIINI